MKRRTLVVVTLLSFYALGLFAGLVSTWPGIAATTAIELFFAVQLSEYMS